LYLFHSEDSDQPGIWWALTKTHQEFFPHLSANLTYCNETTGLIQTERAFGPETNQHFKQAGAVQGSNGDELLKVPDEQPILWSMGPTNTSYPLGGLGLQMKWGQHGNLDHLGQQAFAAHMNKYWPQIANKTLNECKRVHRCYANYTEDGMLQIGCGDTAYPVAFSQTRNATATE
jgi:hypothetical protein